jgi:hypothetical protein
MPEIDADLVQALKMAKAKKMFFVFIPKGGSDGRLTLPGEAHGSPGGALRIGRARSPARPPSRGTC